MRQCQRLPAPDLLRNCSFIREMSDQVLLEMADCMTLKKIAAEQTIFLKGEAGSGLYAVSVGQVKATSISEEGREIILNTFGPGDVFGEVALLDGGPRSANATAMSDGVLAFLSRHDFVRVLEAHPSSAISLLKVVAGRLRHTTEQLEERVFADFEVRLARTLLKLSAQNENNEPFVAMTQQELGEVIGLSREGTNRLLRRWERREIVSIKPGRVTLCSIQALTGIGQLNRN